MVRVGSQARRVINAANGAQAMEDAQKQNGEEVREVNVEQARGRRREQDLVFSEAALVRAHAFLGASRAGGAVAADGAQVRVGGKKREGQVSETRAWQQEEDRNSGSDRLRWMEPTQFDSKDSATVPRRDGEMREHGENSGSSEREQCPRRESGGGGAQQGEVERSKAGSGECANDRSRCKRRIAATVSGKDVSAVSNKKGEKTLPGYLKCWAGKKS